MVSSVSNSASTWASTLFSKLDTGNKGYISESDLSNAFSSTLNSSASDASSSASSLFSSLDSDSDGKVSESELATTLQTLSDQLNNQYDASRMASAMGAAMPPPSADSSSQDEGYTQDELTSIASTTTDSNLASLMSNVASNFSAADTNGDGKVNAAEAMAYQQSTGSTQSIANDTGDEGFTEDELTSIASTTTDSNLASLMSTLASNFSSADTNGDGKVSSAEAMAYQQGTAASSENAGNATTASSSASSDETVKRILAMLQAYSTNLGSSSSLSLTA